MERNNVSFLKPRAIGLIIKASGLLPSTIAFIALFLVCSVLVALFEPNVNGFANSLWFMF